MENKAQRETMQEWFKRHSDTILILGAIFSSFLWMNGKFNSLETRLTKIETVLILKGIIPEALAKETKNGK